MPYPKKPKNTAHRAPSGLSLTERFTKKPELGSNRARPTIRFRAQSWPDHVGAKSVHRGNEALAAEPLNGAVFSPEGHSPSHHLQKSKNRDSQLDRGAQKDTMGENEDGVDCGHIPLPGL